MEKELKIKVWELIESYIENASDSIGIGSMDSLCEELFKTINSENKCRSCNSKDLEFCEECMASYPN